MYIFNPHGYKQGLTVGDSKRLKVIVLLVALGLVSFYFIKNAVAPVPRAGTIVKGHI